MAARQGDMKLVRRRDQADELYNLSEDIGEAKDLAATVAKTAQSLAAAMDAWSKTLVPPAFPGLGGRAAKAGKPVTIQNQVEP